MTELSYRSPKAVVRESPIHGKGLFAKEAFSAGEIVAVKGGYILTKETWDIVEEELGSADIQIAEDLFIAPVRKEERDGAMLYTPGCRGTITGKDWMRTDLQEKYRGWFCWFLQRKIDEFRSKGDRGAVKE